nr:30S ribosomal protein S1 [Anaerolineae bacterium]
MHTNNGDEDVQDFGQMLDSYYSFDEPKRGDIREAVILQIDENEIVVDLGGKRDGIVPSQDLERLTPSVLDSLQVGDVVPVYILNPSDNSGNLLVSINLGLQGSDWTRAQRLLENDETVDAVVTGYNRGGLLVKFGQIEGFVPVSHVLDIPQGLPSDTRGDAMASLVSSTLVLKVIEVNQQRRRLIFSQREAQREWRAVQKEKLLNELAVGDIIPGRVTGVRDFGVFVDIGGADGLIHVSELAWHRIPHPNDILSIGDEINVYVLDLDHKKQRIALSLCRAMSDPWETVQETYSIGQIVQGTVNNVVDFGAFVVLDDGIEGLLHVTEMADGSLTEPFSYIQRGDRISLQIVRIEVDEKRIGFTQKGLQIDTPTDDLSAINGPDDVDNRPLPDPAEDSPEGE